ncbi:hypothetical protein [Nocardia sp. CA-119907]|uniref:hypothetical protein n=1 Tax=Nocardia sp. CA-119907 TaxID=3239973 RepID=UPI003D991435
MSVASGTVEKLGATASATVHVVEAAGGAAVGAVTGAARGTVEGAVSGARSGIDVSTATVLGVIAAGVTGLVEWPVAVAAGGIAGAAYLLRHTRTESGKQVTAKKPQPRRRTGTRPKKAAAASPRARTRAK